METVYTDKNGKINHGDGFSKEQQEAINEIRRLFPNQGVAIDLALKINERDDNMGFIASSVALIGCAQDVGNYQLQFDCVKSENVEITNCYECGEIIQ